MKHARKDYHEKTGGKVLDCVNEFIMACSESGTHSDRAEEARNNLAVAYARYGEVRIPEDEPVFLLRAQDIVAVKAVRYWAQLLFTEHEGAGTEEMYELTCEQIKRMEAWKKKKVPDLPHAEDLPTTTKGA